MNLLQKIKAKLLQMRDNRRIAKKGFPVVHLGPAGAPRALLMYLSPPLTWGENDPRLDWHENQRQSRQIADILVECGYQVDVTDMRDDRFVPDGEYQLFIGHGTNAGNIASAMGKETRKICLATGQYGPYANRNVEKRYLELEQRKHVRIDRRMPSTATPAHYKVFDEIACFGNKHTAASFSELQMPVHTFVNYFNPKIRHLKKDYSSAKSGFVYIAASRPVLKGLDLLIDVFSSIPDVRLFVLGKVDVGFRSVYKKQLKRQSNIRLCGYVQAGGRQWMQICSQAAWYISPTASEGMQGTALNAMAAGLVPILSPEAGVDLYGVGNLLGDYSIRTLEQKITQLVDRDDEFIRRESSKAVEVACKYYRPDNFCDNWRGIITG
jgi:glycosyltransferase involved in cell wall biosynthesis